VNAGLKESFYFGYLSGIHLIGSTSFFSEGIMTNQTALKLDAKIIIRIVIYLFFVPLVLFLASWQFDWVMGWVYAILGIVLSIGSRILMARRHPDLVAERASFQDAEGAKDWDKKLVPWVAQILPFVGLVVAGLDKRFGWTPELPLWSALVALGVGILGFAFSTWALVENRFFSSVVRIQTERGQTVCNTGPYHYVRHPGYAGGLLWTIVTPLILGTLWAFIPTIIMVSLTVLRTSLEDKTLQEELPGYQDYTRQTRYRLLPGIW
jgi:protein-S-isoprenylcysteine O-methyltransferase Ste14